MLLDNVLAERRQRAMPGFTIQPQTVAIGHYVGVLAAKDAPLRDAINDVLRGAMRDGSLERIFRKWNVWNEDQPALYAKLLAGEAVPAVVDESGLDAPVGTATLSGWEAARRYFPSLLRASAVTLVLSCLSMGLAVVLGVLIATGRVYGARPLRLVLVGYVELMRGTPILLQLFVLYYGIAAAIRLPAFAAALLGLALNYAAYESEIYRSALEAVPTGQLEAARTLGLSERQVLRLVRGPQAFRLALAPMTNDFVALLKDSSLVSVLTVMELTKQTQIFATNLGSWVIPGTMCAALYLALGAGQERETSGWCAWLGGRSNGLPSHVELRGRTIERHLRPEPPHQPHPSDVRFHPAVDGPWLKRDGDVHGPSGLEAVEGARRDADNRDGLTLEIKGAADDVRIAREGYAARAGD